MPVQKSDGRRKLESGGGSGGGGLGGDGLGQQIKREEEINPDVDPCLRVMERLREFFCKNNREDIMCPKG